MHVRSETRTRTRLGHLSAGIFYWGPNADYQSSIVGSQVRPPVQSPTGSRDGGVPPSMGGGGGGDSGDSQGS